MKHRSYPTPFEDKQPLVIPKLPPMELSKTPLHDALGVTPEYTRGEYMKIVNQDDHLPTKLKALAPFARELGLEADPTIAQSTQNIIIMMPPEIVNKYKLAETELRSIADGAIIDV